jgi:hypothetical protein
MCPLLLLTCVQVAVDLSAAAAAISAHPSKLLLPGSSQLTYAEISLATALNKLAELNKPLPPATAALASSAAAAAGGTEDAAAAGAAGEPAAETVADCIPHVKQLLQQFPQLLQWAQDMAQQHRAAGAAMPPGS